jgi:hypothetical protein
MFYVFDEGQFAQALMAYTERREQQGVSQARADEYQIREFMKSPEAQKFVVQPRTAQAAAK